MWNYTYQKTHFMFIPFYFSDRMSFATFNKECTFKFGDCVYLGDTEYIGIIRGKATVNLPGKATGWIVQLPQKYIDMYHEKTGQYWTHAQWVEAQLRRVDNTTTFHQSQ